MKTPRKSNSAKPAAAMAAALLMAATAATVLADGVLVPAGERLRENAHRARGEIANRLDELLARTGTDREQRMLQRAEALIRRVTGSDGPVDLSGVVRVVRAMDRADDPALEDATGAILDELVQAVEELRARVEGCLPALPDDLRAKAEKLLARAERRVRIGMEKLDRNPPRAAKQLRKAMELIQKADALCDGYRPEEGPAASDDPADPVAEEVFVNDQQIPDPIVQEIVGRHETIIENGRFWYDRESGAWGFDGGPAEGFVPAGMDLGGPMRPDASNGHTGVFVNGRELPARELIALRQLAGEAIGEGHHSLDGNGFLLSEDGTLLVDLAGKASEKREELGDRTYYRRTVTDPSGIGNPASPHFIGKDYLVIVGF